MNTLETFTLKERLAIVDKKTSDESKKAIHYKSLRNFIYYYDSLKKGKLTATRLLRRYFDYIENENYSLNKEQSFEAYRMYIGPLASKVYRRYLNFSCCFAILFEIFLYIIPNSILWVLFHSTSLIMSVVPLYMVYWINYIAKYRNHKIYGYRY